MPTRHLLLLAFLLCAGARGACLAQELNANVTVNAPNLTIIDRKVMDEFETSVRDFLNNTKFTDEVYEPDERITCNFTFSVTGETNERQFNVDLLIQSGRPVYNSDYTSTLINYLDKPAVIQYEQFQPLEYNRNGYTTPLVALLSFYVHVIVGMDRESFAPMGGEPFFRQAEQIMSTIPPALAQLDKSWGNSGGQRSRYRLLQEILNPRARPYRQMMYDYHRQGLDVMAGDAVAGRAVMGTALEQLKKVRSDIPNSILISNFSSAKSQEIVEVFLPAPPTQRQSAYQVMASIDPSNINKFRVLR